MPLVLTIVRQPEGASVADTRKLFTESGGTLGRSGDNSWALPDPSRFVSSHHASIRYDRGDYYLVDTSTNGVYVNSNSNPLGTGNQVRLQTGDKLYLGEYEIHVEFEQSDVPQAAMSSDDFDQWLEPESNEPEVASNDFNDLLTPEQELLDPLAALDKAKGPANDQWQGASQADNAALSDQAFIPPNPILESAAPSPSPSASGAAGVIPDDWDLDDLLSDEPAKPQPATPVTPEPAGSPAIPTPGVASEPVAAIPDDDLLGDIDALLDGPEDELLTPEESAAKEDGNELDAFLGIDSTDESAGAGDSLAALLESTPSDDEPPAPVQEKMEAEVSLSDVQIEPEETAPPAIAKDIPQPPREPVPTPVTAEQPAIPAPPKPQVTAPPVPPTPAPPASTPPAPTPPAPPASPEPPAAPVPDSLLDASVSQPAAPVPQPTADSCDALIRSLGLDPDLMTAETRKNFQRVLADTLRETVGGMMKVLGARNAIKNEFRMNVTMIQPMENNPLKFSPNVDEALRNMFTSQSNAYMPGTIAIREGFQDVADHQVAVIAGMRAAFRSLLKRFEPEALQVRFDKQHQAGFLSSKKGKYWEAYGDFYRDLSDNMDDAFQDLFGEDFAEAYEQQMARLEASRKK